MRHVYIKGIHPYRYNIIAKINCTGILFVCLFVTGFFGIKMLKDYNCTIFQMNVILVLIFLMKYKVLLANMACSIKQYVMDLKLMNIMLITLISSISLFSFPDLCHMKCLGLQNVVESSGTPKLLGGRDRKIWRFKFILRHKSRPE